MGFRIHRGIFQKLEADGRTFTNAFKVDTDGRVKEVDADGNVVAGYLKVDEKAADANLLDGINSTSFLRSDADDETTGVLRVNKNWGGGYYNAESFTIRGTYPSFTLRNTGSNNKWLFHSDSSGKLQMYEGNSTDNNTWDRHFEFDKSGNFTVVSGNITTVGTVFADVFSDRNNTSYYLDPANISYLNDLRPNIIYDRNDTNYKLDLNGDSRAKNFRTTGEFFAEQPAWGGFPLAPNLIHNSYMNKVTNGVPDGWSVLGDITIEAVSPWTKAFEGPYTAEPPANAVDDPEDATESNPYWFSRYYNGPRIARGGMRSGWHSQTDGKILKVTGTGVVSPAHCAIYPPKEENNLGARWLFSCFVKIVKGSAFHVGTDAGYRSVSGSRLCTKEESDAGPQGWIRVSGMLGTSQITRLDGLAMSLSIIPDANGDIEGYIALPYLANATYKGTNYDSWSGSVLDKLARQGLYIHPTNGAITSSSNTFTIGGNQVATQNWVTGTAKAADSNLLDGINSTSFLRSDAYDEQTTGFKVRDIDIGYRGDRTIQALNSSGTIGTTGDLHLQHFGGDLHTLHGGGTLYVNDAAITSGKIANWDNAYSWGNHASAGYAYSASTPFIDSTTQRGPDFNTLIPSANQTVFKELHAINEGSNAPSAYTYGVLQSTKMGSMKFQWYVPHTASRGDNNTQDTIWFRTGWGGTQIYDWKYLIHSGNIAGQSVNYATTAGTANAVTWANVSGKPSTFAPSAHSHTFASITNKTAFVDNAMLSSRGTRATDTIGDSAGVSFNYLLDNQTSPTGVDHALMTMSYSNAWQTQLAQDWRENGRIYIRGQEGGTWSAWGQVWSSHDFNPSSFLTSLPSHNHDSRYYTETEADARFLGISAKASDSSALDGKGWGSSGKNVRATEFYADNWFRNYNSDEGLYNERTGQHWYSDHDDYWNIAGGGSANGIRFRDQHRGTVRGYVYANNSNEVGFLDAGGSWAIRHTNDWGTRFYTDGETLEFRVGRDAVTGNYGTVQTSTTRSGWGGYSINGQYVLMSNHGNDVGIYNDIDNEWMTRWHRNGKTELHYNGSSKLATTSSGISVTGTVSATEFVGDGSRLTGISAGSAPVTTSVEGGEPSTLSNIHFNPGEGVATFTLADGSSYRLAFAR